MAALPPQITVVHGNFESLAPKVQEFVVERVKWCEPNELHICDGSDQEFKSLIEGLVKIGAAEKLDKYDNCYACRTNPADVARVESRTVICTKNKRETIPQCKEGVVGQLGRWADSDEMDKKLKTLLQGCMKGRTMYLVPFSMGPVGSPLSKIGIQLTDSAYVSICMKIMARMGTHVLQSLGNDEFVRCLHSVGKPLPTEEDPYNWPCNPENVIVTHFPARREIISYGSGYGGNSLLGKKCFALRIASNIAREEGWLAEHMLILGVTNPEGEKKYIAAAFPSACGKTNLAMMTPSLPGWKVECVGDDIAWMKFDEEGTLRAINAEYGFFGVAPGTSNKTNPMAMEACYKNTVFTNVATTSDGDFYWEGLEKERDLSRTEVTDWLGKSWKPGQETKAAHPNSRFCAPAANCPVIDPQWNDPKGVPISAIMFGGRRPQGVPLIYEAFNWQHGVFMGSSMCSETTAAAEHTGKKIMRDPFAMRPFFGYNAGHYMQHWLDLEKDPKHQMPKIFHVNWFRRDGNGGFLWPGFGENSRVLKWICERVDGKEVAMESALGLVPSPGSLDVDGLGDVNMSELMSVPKGYWLEELNNLGLYYEEQLGEDLPKGVRQEYNSLKQRIEQL